MMQTACSIADKCVEIRRGNILTVTPAQAALQPGMHFRGVEVVLSKQVLVSAGNTGDQCADSTALSNGAGHISIVVYMYTVLSCS